MIITKIEELNNFEDNYDGWKISTDIKIFYILIGNDRDCCEDYGQITNSDDLTYFIGKEIISFKCVDNNDYSSIDFERLKEKDGDDSFECAFIDFETTGGKLQFAVYNSHNGYYGHSVCIREELIYDQE